MEHWVCICIYKQTHVKPVCDSFQRVCILHEYSLNLPVYRVEMKKIVLMIWLCLMMPNIIHGYNKIPCKTSDRPAIFGSTNPAPNCHSVLTSHCYCSTACFEGSRQFVVNCTDTNFNDTSALKYLPAETEARIKLLLYFNLI